MQSGDPGFDELGFCFFSASCCRCNRGILALVGGGELLRYSPGLVNSISVQHMFICNDSHRGGCPFGGQDSHMLSGIGGEPIN